MIDLDVIARECLREATGSIRAKALAVSEQIGAAAAPDQDPDPDGARGRHGASAPGPGSADSPDRALVKQGVAAMLEEAIRRAPAGSRLRVTVKAGPQASMIAIKAPGEGIDPTDSDDVTPPSATEAAASQGGRAWANGRPGRGVTFYLTVPSGPRPPRRATAL